MLDLVIQNVIFTQQCFVLPITNPMVLGSDFLDTRFAVLDIGDSTITLHCADYMLNTSLTHDPVHDYLLTNIVAPAIIEVSYKYSKRKCRRIHQRMLP